MTKRRTGINTYTKTLDNSELLGTKGLLGSKTVWGILIMALAPLLQRWFGVDFSGGTGADIANELPILFGAALAIYGRIKAAGKIDDVF